MIFGNPATVKITSSITGTTNKIAFDGITSSNEVTPESAAEQINKIFGIVDKSVSTNGMTRTITQEAFNNG